jgi:hypothetical protein
VTDTDVAADLRLVHRSPLNFSEATTETYLFAQERHTKKTAISQISNCHWFGNDWAWRQTTTTCLL